MAKKAKGNRVQVILECTEQKASGVPGISRYVTTKNKKNTTDRLERRKYNPFLKRVRSPKTGAYVFTETLVEEAKAKEMFKK